jgi:two-component system OmpR family response regulator
MSAARILVVDDEPGVRDMICDTLRLSGYEPFEANDGFLALKWLRENSVDLVITDINMPNMDGYELLERMRAIGDETPALMLTARGERGDVTRGLRVGADDYVTKPFGLEELMLRIAAILRRTMVSGDAGSADIVCGPIVLNEDRHTVTLHGNPVDLSPTEFKLLYELMIKDGKVVTKATLLDVVWGMAFAANATVVDTYISYLRKKLHTDEFDGIKTVRGIGFQLVAEATAAAGSPVAHPIDEAN